MVICRDCSYRGRHKESKYSSNTTFVCKARARYTDPVTGRKSYAPCSDVNHDGSCSDYKPSILKTILDYFDLNKGWYGKDTK